MLYGLIHARYILTNRGLAQMVRLGCSSWPQGLIASYSRLKSTSRVILDIALEFSVKTSQCFQLVKIISTCHILDVRVIFVQVCPMSQESLWWSSIVLSVVTYTLPSHLAIIILTVSILVLAFHTCSSWSIQSSAQQSQPTNLCPGQKALGLHEVMPCWTQVVWIQDPSHGLSIATASSHQVQIGRLQATLAKTTLQVTQLPHYSCCLHKILFLLTWRKLYEIEKQGGKKYKTLKSCVAPSSKEDKAVAWF